MLDKPLRQPVHLLSCTVAGWLTRGLVYPVQRTVLHDSSKVTKEEMQRTDVKKVINPHNQLCRLNNYAY